MALDKSKLAASARGEPLELSVDDEEPNYSSMDIEVDDFQEHGGGRYGNLIPLLEASAPDILDALNDLPTAALLDPESEMDALDEQLLRDGVSMLPRPLQYELASASTRPMSDGAEEEVGIPSGDAAKIAEHLDEEGMLGDDKARFAGWVVRASRPM